MCYQVDLASAGKGGIVSFLFICLMVGGFGIADASVLGGLVGDLAFMCPEFMQVKFPRGTLFTLSNSYLISTLHLTKATLVHTCLRSIIVICSRSLLAWLQRGPSLPR